MIVRKVADKIKVLRGSKYRSAIKPRSGRIGVPTALIITNKSAADSGDMPVIDVA